MVENLSRRGPEGSDGGVAAPGCNQCSSSYCQHIRFFQKKDIGIKLASCGGTARYSSRGRAREVSSYRTDDVRAPGCRTSLL
jgi:hypothetical protein